MGEKLKFMNEQEAQAEMKTERTARIALAILDQARRMSPEAFVAELQGGIFGSVSLQLSDEYWARMMDVRPCPTVGCDCHMRGQAFMDELNRHREYYRRTYPPSQELAE
jgi:hypothetical protein